MSWKKTLNEWRASMLAYYLVINKHMPIQMVDEDFIEDKYDDTTEHIVKIGGGSCDAAKEVLNDYKLKGDIFNYIQEHHSSIGTDIYRGNEKRCEDFLVDFYSWLSDQRPVNTPKMPKLPEMPDIKITTPEIKVSPTTKIFGVIVMIIIFLIALGYSGTSKVVTSEYERHRK